MRLSRMRLAILYSVNEGRLKRGAVKAVAERMGISTRAVEYVYRRFRKSILDPVVNPLNVTRKNGTGRRRKISLDELRAAIKEIPFSQRTTFRDTATALKIPLYTLRDAKKAGVFQVTGSAIKPQLTDPNKAHRLSYCLSFIDADGCFSDMLDRVDIDEKWFYITRLKRRYFVAPGEKPPHRTCKHKNHLIKVMCLTAMARPRMDPQTGVWWDGKIGTWFFTKQVPAQRNSINRPAKTLETKTINVTWEVTVYYYINHLFPAIEAKWPAWDGTRKVRIQQDNATPHPSPGKDASINLALADMATRGWDVALVEQPANSPDCNTLDLAFFRAIQTIQHTTPSKNIDELISNVMAAHNDLPLGVCQKVWTTAQMVMNEIIRCGGDNTYKLPHAGKDAIVKQLQHSIPYRLPCCAIQSQSALDGASIRLYMTTQGKLLLLHFVVASPSI